MAPKLLPAIATPDRLQRGLEFMVEYYHPDMPMAPVQPLFLMHNGVNRTTMSGRVAGENQRVSREGALRAVTFDAVYSLKLENEVGSIVPGKLANFTIPGDNPLTIDAARIKDIPVWGTVHEGRKLVVKPHAKHAALGPVPNDATFKAMELDALAHAGGEKEAGDLCTLNNQFAATMVSTYGQDGMRTNKGLAQ